MPDITTTTFTDGNTLVADDVAENLYNPDTSATGNTSFEVINGRLDNSNRESGWNADRPHIQHGAASGGGAVGGTLNLDYYIEQFGDYETSDAGPDQNRDLYHAIPGASIEFYLPYDARLVVFSWSVSYQASSTSAEAAHLRMFLDGDDQGYRRTTIPGQGPSGARGEPMRFWTGHDFGYDLTRGWHSVSIRIAVDTSSSLYGVRVRCRHMDYVYFS